MKKSEEQLNKIKQLLEQMFDRLMVQLTKGKAALDTFDEGIVEEILAEENHIDNFENLINHECETFLAMHTPVAADLRMIMAINNINPSAERIGDNIEKIGKYVRLYKKPLPEEIETTFNVEEMYEHLLSMFDIARESFKNVETQNLRKIYEKDWVINKINKSARGKVIEMINKYPDHNAQILHYFLIINRLERIGDHIKNIGEEIIFAKEGRIVRHSKEKL